MARRKQAFISVISLISTLGVAVVPSDEPVGPSVGPPSECAAAAGFDAERASFFAQPLPLKTMAGVVSALRITPPQTSQASGPDPWIEWTTSTERPHDVQRYS